MIYKLNGYLLLIFQILLGIIGIFSLNKFNLLPVKFININLIFIFSFTVLFTLFLKKKNILTKFNFIVLNILSFYLIFTFVNSVVIHNVYILDYLVAYLSFFYIIIFLILYNKIKINIIFFKYFFFIILIIFLTKYFLAKVLFKTLHRPGVFTENNYELLLLGLISFAYIILYKRLNFFLILVLGIIYILGSSKSGILIYSILLIFNYRNIKKNIIFHCFLLIISIAISYFIFRERLSAYSSIDDIDRFHFLIIFIKEIKDWNMLNYLFGMHPLTPLSFNSCQELSFYQNLFSYSGNGTCYAVVLHSYILRILFNHGIIMFLFIFWIVYKILLNAGLYKKEAYIIIVFLLINSLSVSSINNIFTLLGLLILTNMSVQIRGYNYVPKLKKI